MNRALIVEGRPDLAELLVGMMQEEHFEVVLATSLLAAKTEAHSADVQFALLEVNLGSEKSYAVADILSIRGIPFAFINSGGRDGLDRAYWSRPLLVKPFNRVHLRGVIDVLIRNELT